MRRRRKKRHSMNGNLMTKCIRFKMKMLENYLMDYGSVCNQGKVEKEKERKI